VCNGPFARSINDLPIALDVVAGPTPENVPAWRLELHEGRAVTDVTTLRIGTLFDEGADLLPLAEDVRSCLAAFADRLARVGTNLEAAALPVALVDGVPTWQDMVLPIIGMGLPDEAFRAFVGLENLPNDDLSVRGGQAMVARYRPGQGPTSGARASGPPGPPSSSGTTPSSLP
jgi:amidase